MKKVLLVFGTRPEAIKMAPLYHILKNHLDRFDVKVCVTAQHREMLDQVLALFEIKPDIDLDVMEKGQDLFDVNTAVLRKMRDVLKTEQPDIVLVHGDTTTSMAAATAAFYLNIPIGHVEAGLRTFDLKAPFPEEFNRQVTGKLADWHYAPTEKSAKNLLQENVSNDKIVITGNTVIDALHWVLNRLNTDNARLQSLIYSLDKAIGINLLNSKYVLITGHRRENFGKGFLNICEALKILAERNASIHFIYPVHLNPNVQKPVNEILSCLNNVHLIKPLDYEPFVVLLKHSYLVLTDSGGIQEEAPSLGKPVLVMRDTTERPEAVESGTVKLVGNNKENIINTVQELLDDETLYETMSEAHNPYGDGKACERILDSLGTI